MLLNINGKEYTVGVELDVELLSILRNHLDLTGGKYDRGEGECGT